MAEEKEKTGREARATKGRERAGRPVLRRGRVVQSGPARGGWNRLSRCQEPGEDAQPKRQRRPTNSRPHDNATGRETRATNGGNGPGDPSYETGLPRRWLERLQGDYGVSNVFARLWFEIIMSQNTP